jgi:hypothetical protein
MWLPKLQAKEHRFFGGGQFSERFFSSNSPFQTGYVVGPNAAEEDVAGGAVVKMGGVVVVEIDG